LSSFGRSLRIIMNLTTMTSIKRFYRNGTLKPLIIICLFFSIIGCNKGKFDFRDNSELPTAKLVWTGDTWTEIATCSDAITIFRRDIQDNPSTPDSSLEVNLAGMGTGTFHLTNNCSDPPVSSVLILPNTSSQTVYYTNSTVSALSFTATAGTLIQGTHDFTVNTGPPSSLVKISGDLQTGVVGTQLTLPVAAKVMDSGGNPMSGIVVDFSVTLGGGSRSIINATTDMNGLAAATWTIGTVAGALQSLEVSSSSLATLTFTATSVAGTPQKFMISGPASVQAGICSSAISITRQDGYGNNANPSSITPVTLSSSNTNGEFFTANDCSGVSTTTVDINSGDSSASVYFLSHEADDYILTSDSFGFWPETYDLEVTGLASIISFSRNTFSINEDGSTIGPSVTLNRTITTISHSVTLSLDPLTADSGDLDLNPKKVLFLPGEVSKTFSASDFSVINDSSVEGDKFFRIKLTNLTNGAITGDVYETQVNLIDDDFKGEFFFSDTIYSAAEDSGTLTGIVQRSGSTAASASVNLTFLDGTASDTIDFDGTPINITFGIGESEKTFSVPIINTTDLKDNKSFYLELLNPSPGTSVRNWATAKARILDEDDPTSCDSTNVNLSINNGFGGGAGSLANPYLICSLPQLYQVRNNLTANFRVMSDLDLDPSLDADPRTASVQPYGPITGLFSGSFNGDERILKNFRHTQLTASASPVAFFNMVGNNPLGFVNGLNLIQGYSISNVDNNHMAGIVGKITNDLDTLSNNSFSGFVFSKGPTGSAGGVLNRSEGNPSSSLVRNLASGSVVSQFAGGGILAGIFMNSATANIVGSFSNMNLLGAGDLGGISGRLYGHTDMVHIITKSHHKGYVSSAGAGAAGGIIGQFYGDSSSILRIANSKSSGTVKGATRVGGFIGELRCRGTQECTLENNTSTAAIFGESTTNIFVGGFIGKLLFEGDVLLENIVYAGTIKNSLGNLAHMGGLIGQIDSSTGSGKTLTFNNCSASGNLSYAGMDYPYASGGILGEISLSSETLNTLNLSSLTSSMEVQTQGDFSGGLIGRIIDASTLGGNRISITTSAASGAVSGQTSAGLIGEIFLVNTIDSIFTIEDSSSSGAVSSFELGGGLVGSITTGTNAKIGISDSFSTSNVSSLSSGNGGLIGEIFMDGTSGNLISLINTWATGHVSGVGRNGGLIGGYSCGEDPGAKLLKIHQSRASGNVISTTGEGTGGLVGALGKTSLPLASTDCRVTIQDTYSDSPSVSASGAGYVGGLIGFTLPPTGTTSNYQVINSYSVSPVASAIPATTSGLLNYETSKVSVTNSFWLRDVGHNDVNVVNDVHSRTQVQMFDVSTYPWDPSTWLLLNGSYPTFQP
jgi:hypothetical protein